jgi:hypothetical protein
VRRHRHRWSLICRARELGSLLPVSTSHRRTILGDAGDEGDGVKATLSKASSRVPPQVKRPAFAPASTAIDCSDFSLAPALSEAHPSPSDTDSVGPQA